MFNNHRNEDYNSKVMLVISNSFIVTKAQKEEGIYSKSQNKTVAELAININAQKHSDI